MKNIPMNLMLLIIAIIIGISFVLGMLVVPLEKKSDYITVGGQSEVTVKPDGVIIYLTINTLEDTAQKAQDSNAKVVADVRSALNKKGIEDKNIQNTNYYLDKKTDWSMDGPIEKGYELSYTLKVYASVSNAGDAIKAAVDNGVNSVGSIEFLISKDAQNAAVAEAMSKATLVATQKAKKVTESVGANLGRVLKIEEGSWWVVPSNEAATDAELIPAEYSGNMISPQRMAVSANVNVVFEVK